MTIGPIQLVVLGFEEPDRLQGRILAELEEIRGRDVVRLLDLLFVARDEAGGLAVLELPGEDWAGHGALLGALLGLDAAGDGQAPDDTVPEGTEAGLTSEEVRRVAATLEPGTAAALLLVEHRWAARLAAAVRDAGGRLVAQGFLTPDARVVLGEELAAAAEAEAALEVAEAVRGAALVEALRDLDEVETVRALVAAGVLEDTAALEGVEALVAAGLIDPAVVQAAADAEPTATDAREA
jgi:uncharacterized membrane protein